MTGNPAARERAAKAPMEPRHGVEPGDLPPEVLGEGGVGPVSGNFDEQIAGMEQGLLKRALDGVGGSQKEAARGLGLSYDRFRHLLRKHQLIGK